MLIRKNFAYLIVLIIAIVIGAIFGSKIFSPPSSNLTLEAFYSFLPTIELQGNKYYVATFKIKNEGNTPLTNVRVALEFFGNVIKGDFIYGSPKGQIIGKVYDTNKEVYEIPPFDLPQNAKEINFTVTSIGPLREDKIVVTSSEVEGTINKPYDKKTNGVGGWSVFVLIVIFLIAVCLWLQLIDSRKAISMMDIETQYRIKDRLEEIKWKWLVR